MSFKFNNSAALIVVPSPSFVRLRLPSSTTRVVLPLVVVLSNQSSKFILHSLDSGVVQSPSSLAHQKLPLSIKSILPVVVVLSNQDRSFSSPALVVPSSTITVLPLVVVLSNLSSFYPHSPTSDVVLSPSSSAHQRLPLSITIILPLVVLLSNQDRSSSPALAVPSSTITVLPLVVVLSNQSFFDLRSPTPDAVLSPSSSAHHRLLSSITIVLLLVVVLSDQKRLSSSPTLVVIPSAVAPAHYQPPSSSRNCSSSDRCRIAVPFCSFSQAKQVALSLLSLLVSRICGQPFFRSLSCSFVPSALPTPPMFPPVPATLRRMFTRSFSRTMCLLLLMLYFIAFAVASPLPQIDADSSRSSSSKEVPGILKAMKVGKYDWDKGWKTWTTKFGPPDVAQVPCLLTRCYGYNAKEKSIKTFTLGSNYKTSTHDRDLRLTKVAFDIKRFEEEERDGLTDQILALDVSKVQNDNDWFHLFCGFVAEKQIIVKGYEKEKDIMGNLKNAQSRGLPWTFVAFGYADFVPVDGDPKPDDGGSKPSQGDSKPADKVQWRAFSKYAVGTNIGREVNPGFLCFALFSECFGFDPASKEIREVEAKTKIAKKNTVLIGEFYPSAKPRLRQNALQKSGKTIEENKEAIRQILLNKKELEKRARITITDFRSYSRAACQVLSEEGYMEAHTEEETYVPNILLGTSGRRGNGDDEDMGDVVNEDVADNADTGSTDKGKAPELTQPKVLNPMDIGSLLNPTH